MKAWTHGCLAALVAGAVASSAAADEFKLKFAHLFPETQYIWSQGGKVFADVVTEMSQGRVTFEVYPAAQLGKDMNALASSGLADMVILIPSYDPAKFPRSSVMDLPGMYASSCEGARKVWALTKDGGLLAETEYGPQKLRVIFVGTNPPNQVMTAKKPITSVADIAGLKLRSLGSAGMDKTLRALDAVPVKMNSSDVYDSASRGTIDGAVYPYIGMPDYELETVLHYSLEGHELGSGSFIYAIREKSWEKLPEDVQKIMLEAGQKALTNLCTWQDTNNAAFRDRFIAENGFTTTTLSYEEGKKWDEHMATVASAWASEMDAAGLDGSGLLAAFREAKGE